MVKGSLFLVAILFVFGRIYAQEHNYGANYNCKLKSGNYINIEKHSCPGCVAKEKRDEEAKKAEEKRKFDAAQKKAEEEKAALEKERQEELDRKANEEEDTKVYINGNNSSSEGSESESSEKKTSGTPSSSSSSEENVPFDYDTYYKYYATPEEKSAHDTQLLYNSAVELGASLEQWKTDKINRENAKYANERAINDARRADYETFENNLKNKLSDSIYFNQYVIQKIPDLLVSTSPSWELLLNSKELPLAFGENSEYIISNFTPISGKVFGIEKEVREDIEEAKMEWYTYLPTFGGFTSRVEYKYTYNLNGVNYPWRAGFQGTGIQHQSQFIYNDKNSVIGVFLKWLTHYSEDFPSFYIEDYYKDLLTKVGANYLLLDANTILLKDKLIIIRYDGIELYDLKLLGDQYLVNWNNYRTFSGFKSLGIGFKQLTVKTPPFYLKELSYDVYETSQLGVVIGRLVKDGKAEKAGLKVGDIINKINGLTITSPYMLQLIIQAPTIDNKIEITYLRNGIEYKTTVNI